MAALKSTAKKTATSKKKALKKVIVKKTVAKPAAKKVVATKKASVKEEAVKKAIVKKPGLKKTISPKAPQGPSGIPEQLLDATLKILEERQAEEIVVIPLAGRSSVADYIVLASGRAGRQIAAISDYLREAYFKLGVRQVRIEGKAEANWVLIDAGDIIVHLFRPEVRSYYDLDKIWNKK